MTDNTTKTARIQAGGLQLTCILYEGAVTIGSNFLKDGTKAEGMPILAAELDVGQWVQPLVSTAVTAAAAKDLPVVTKAAAGAPLTGKIVSIGGFKTVPTKALANEAAVLSNHGYRLATVWFPGLTAYTKAVLKVDGTNAVTVGSTELAIKAADQNGKDDLRLIRDATGTGLVSMHYAAKGTADELETIWVGFTGGPVKVVA